MVSASTKATPSHNDPPAQEMLTSTVGAFPQSVADKMEVDSVVSSQDGKRDQNDRRNISDNLRRDGGDHRPYSVSAGTAPEGAIVPTCNARK
jgi:hypothetical protein